MDKVEFICELYMYKNIYIYGAGEYAKTLAYYLLNNTNVDGRVKGFVVTTKTNKSAILGKPIVELTDIDLIKVDLIIVAVSEDKQSEILNSLNNVYDGNVLSISDDDYSYMKKLERSEQYNVYLGEEILNRTTLDIVLRECEWVKNCGFVPGGMAVNSKYLYILFKILESRKFKSILDIGMGQTSKLIGEYACAFSDVEHIIVEADEEWKEFFVASNDVEKSQIIMCDYEIEKINDISVRRYKDFREKLLGKKFDVISIDAPLGADMTLYSRIDILELLPECLKESWIIMMDDTGRSGERNTIEKVKKILTKTGKGYVEKKFMGFEKDFTLLASVDNRFFTSI
ncbi:MAG: nucleoside-diphosphate sugar epimerase/dehydratase [Lachnospiraceae bacterium]